MIDEVNMPIGTTAALLIAGGSFTAATQIGAGKAQAKSIQRQSEYNAQIYDQQATMIQEKKKIQDYQFNRERARARGAITASSAGKGFLLSGSPLAILADTESQLLFDQAIGKYNLDIEQNFAKSGATNTRESGAAQSRLAKFTGYSNAFSTILSTGVSAAGYSGGSSGGYKSKYYPTPSQRAPVDFYKRGS